MLTTQHLTDFRTLGYTALSDFFTAAEVHALRVELARLRSAGEGRNVSTDGDGKTCSQIKVNFHICPLNHRSPLIRALPFDERVVTTIPCLLGCDARLRLDQIFLKPAHCGAGTNWHQDNAYFRYAQAADATRGVGMWIAIHDATIANGTMHVIPAAFSRVVEHERDGGSNHHVTCGPVIDESRAVPIELPAGGVLFFNYGVPHCTKANTSDRDRAGLALHFEDLTLPVCDAPGRVHPIISGPKATGGEAEYGEDLRGVWRRMVAEAQEVAVA